MVDMNNFKLLKYGEVKKNIEELHNGKIEARNNLISHFANKLYRIIESKYFNYEQEELFQVGIVAIMEFLDSCYENDTTLFEAKIYKYIESSIKNYINNNIKYKYKEKNIIENIEVDGFDDLINIDYINKINQLIKNFNPKYQEFFKLYFYYNYSHYEIADIYGTNKKYVSTIMGQKIRDLKEKINNDYTKVNLKDNKKIISNKKNRIEPNKLENIKINNVEIIKNNISKYEYILELLKDSYNINSINIALKRLERKNIDYNYFSYYEIKNFLIHKIIKIIDETTNRKGTIFEFFPEYEIDEINNIIFLLPKSDKQLLEFVQKNNFNKKLHNIIISEFVETINNILLKKDSIYNHRKNTIYENFEDYSEEEIDCILNVIDPNNKLKIELYYSKPFLKTYLEDDLKNIIKTINKELQQFSIIYRQKFVMYNYFGKYCKPEIINIVNCLPDEDKSLLVSIFGKDLNKKINKILDEYTLLKVYSIIKKIENNLNDINQKKKILK